VSQSRAAAAPPRAASHRGAEENQRAARRCHQRQRLVHGPRGGRCRRLGPRRPRRAGVTDRGLEQIAWQAHVHRAGPAAPRQLERGRDVLAEPGRVLGHPRGLGHRRRHRGLVDLLEGPAPDLSHRRVPAQEDHRRLRHERAVEGGDRVAMARARGDEGHPRLPGEAAPCVRHVHGGGLVARVENGQAAAAGGVVEGQDLVARQREEVADRGGDQRLHDQTRAGPGHAGLTAPGRARRPARPPPPARFAPRRSRPPCW